MSKTKKLLQSLYPNLTWKSVKYGFGWAWESNEGHRAEWKSQSVSMSPNDSDSHARSVLYLETPGKPEEPISWGKIYTI